MHVMPHALGEGAHKWRPALEAIPEDSSVGMQDATPSPRIETLHWTGRDVEKGGVSAAGDMNPSRFDA